MTRTLLSHCAPLAIAASVALPFIPAMAQDAATAQPVIVLPEPAPAAATPAPTIVLPEPVAEPAPVAATVAASQEDAVAAPVTRTSQRRASAIAPRTVAARNAAPAGASAAMSAAEPVAPQAATPKALPVTPAGAAAATAPLPAVAESNVRASDTGEIAVAGLLGALGLAAVGGVAYAASRRRRRRVLSESHDEPAYSETVYEAEAQPMAAAVAPAMVAESVAQPVPAFAASAPVASAFAAPVVARSASARSQARANGDPVPLPAGVPESFDERDALLKELVAAKPDRANPFTGVRARARRAKLIMQSLGQDFRDRKPRIDLSEYTNRWPALRGWQPATA